LLQASSAPIEEDSEEVMCPLMMMPGGERPGPHEKASEGRGTENNRDGLGENDLRCSTAEENSDRSSLQSRGDLSHSIQENKPDFDQKMSSSLPEESGSMGDTAANNRSLFRLTDNGWERQDPVTKMWKPTDHFQQDALEQGTLKTVISDMPREIIARLPYSRADEIAKKKSRYQEELRSLPPESDRAKLLTQLTPLLDQAMEYQRQIVSRILDGTKNSNATQSQGLKTSLALEKMVNVNDRPSKIERLIEEIKKDHQGLAEAQEIDSVIGAKIATLEEEEEHLEAQGKAVSMSLYDQLDMLEEGREYSKITLNIQHK
jgi:hypothetical protein